MIDQFELKESQRGSHSSVQTASSRSRSKENMQLGVPQCCKAILGDKDQKDKGTLCVHQTPVNSLQDCRYKMKTIIRSVFLENQKYDYAMSAPKDNHQFVPTKMEYYLASGHIKNFRFEDDKLYKKAKQRELDFYRNNHLEDKFNPKCFGIEGQFVILENLLRDIPFPSVIDIKLGRSSNLFKVSQAKKQMQDKKTAISSSQSLGFRISGYVTPDTKEFGLLVKDQVLIRWILSKIVNQSNKDQILQFLGDLSTFLRGHNRVYQATSLLIISGANVTRVKWIDFSYWMQSEHPDYGLLQGLENIARIIDEI